jgi:pimeloyl-ACP methyl ester carboxylesterase
VAAPTTRYARSGDVHLAYQVIGDGPRDLVLSLDWASHLEVLWEQLFVQELVSALARFSRVLWFDMRGVGLSDRVLDAPAAAEDWVDDVAAVMDAAGSERASLVAHGHAAGRDRGVHHRLAGRPAGNRPRLDNRAVRRRGRPSG